MNSSGYPEVAPPGYRPPNPLVKVVTPYVTYTLMGVTIVIFLLQMATEALLGYDLPAILGMKINELIAQGQVWRLITPVFLHGSVVHIGFNMYALFVMGPSLERAYGHGRFSLLYFLSAYAGNVFSFLFLPAPSLGASTAIFGLIGAELVLLYRNKEYIVNARGMLNQTIVIAVINFAIGFSSGMIDNWGHLGGLLGGATFAWFAGPLLSFDIASNSVVDAHTRRDEISATAVVFLSFTVAAILGFLP